MKIIIALLLVVGLYGCQKKADENGYIPVYGRDTVLRGQRFDACLKLTPASPVVVNAKTTEWSEVIAKCDNASYYQSRCLATGTNPTCIPD